MPAAIRILGDDEVLRVHRRVLTVRNRPRDESKFLVPTEHVSQHARVIRAATRSKAVGSVGLPPTRSACPGTLSARQTHLETVRWRGRAVHVPVLELQLLVAEHRGLDDRVHLIRSAVTR